jgi:hypothetical protein
MFLQSNGVVVCKNFESFLIYIVGKVDLESTRSTCKSDRENSAKVLAGKCKCSKIVIDRLILDAHPDPHQQHTLSVVAPDLAFR